MHAEHCLPAPLVYLWCDTLSFSALSNGGKIFNFSNNGAELHILCHYTWGGTHSSGPDLQHSQIIIIIILGFWSEVILSFSALSNGEKIFNFSNSGGELQFINGIRALSFGWVILGHTFWISEFTGIFLNLESQHIYRDRKKFWANYTSRSLSH